MREKAVKAAAIVLNVRVLVPGRSEKGDASEVKIDHRDGYSVHVFLSVRLTDDMGIIRSAVCLATECLHIWLIKFINSNL